MKNKKKLRVAKLDCSLCGKEIDEQVTNAGTVFWTEGHSAAPLNDGRCCTDCNNQKVIPYRLVCRIEDGLDKCNALIKQIVHSVKVDGTNNIHALKYQYNLVLELQYQTKGLTKVMDMVDG